MDDTASGSLVAAAPFDFELSLRFINGFGPIAGEQRSAGRTLAKALFANGQPLLALLSSAGDASAPRLDYTLHAEGPIDPVTQRAAEDRIGFFLSLADDLRPFYALAEGDSIFAPIVRQLHGYHQVKFLTPFENAAWAVLTQRNSLAAARGLKHRLIERFGAAAEHAGQRYPIFPEAATLAQADPGELFDLLPAMRRAEYLQAVARAFAQADEAWLRAAPYAEVESWLRAINGIGAWSASFILLRGLGRAERLPVGENKLAAAVEKHYAGGRRLSPPAVAALAARYGDYQGYWAHYLRVAG